MADTVEEYREEVESRTGGFTRNGEYNRGKVDALEMIFEDGRDPETLREEKMQEARDYPNTTRAAVAKGVADACEEIVELDDYEEPPADTDDGDADEDPSADTDDGDADGEDDEDPSADTDDGDADEEADEIVEEMEEAADEEDE